MLDPKEPSYHQPLEGGLVLRTAADEGDVERVAAFNGAIHEPGVAAMTRNLFLHHPHTRGRDLVFVEEEGSRQVVSSLCLIPWTWRYEDVEIRAGEMGIVGTLESHRQRGLIRAQVDYFKRRMRERGCLLSQIQGIPYFYRQFGYEYALPLEGGLRLEFRDVPAPPQDSFTFCPAREDDLPTLMRLYEEAAADLTICAARDEATWRYLLTHTDGSEMERDTWMIRGADGELAGYVCVPKHHFGEELVASEVSRLGFDTALATLDQLRKLGVERDKPGVRLNLPANCTLMRLARSLGAHDLGTYAWQIHVLDFAALLRALKPVLERRVAQSPFAGLTRDVGIGLYREALIMRFVEGELMEVAGGEAVEDAAIHLPPLQFIPLVLGYRTVEELRAARPDVRVEPAWRLLVDTLFPKVTAFIYTIY